MSVISLSFLLFAAVSCTLYFLLPPKVRPYWLLLCSMVFYGSFDKRFFLWIGITAGTTFAAGLMMGTAQTRERLGWRKAVLIGAVAINAGMLIFVKFFGYSVELFGRIFGLDTPAIMIPAALGIAFYTMQAISYCVDVYRGKYPPERNLCKYLLYMLFFPTIMQGPISRYDQLADQLFTPHRFSFDRMKSGLILTMWGFFKKLVIADRAAILVNRVFGNYGEYEGFQITVAVLLYSIQLYTDFSGFTDISRGISQVLGIELVSNFDTPYFADSIRDFWRRWHLSLSSWLRDYIYIPLGGSRRGRLRKYINLMIVFFVSGLWHGVGVHYIVWGLLQGIFQIVGDRTEKTRYRVFDAWGVDRTCFSYRLGKRLVTFALVNVSWLIFRASGFLAALHMLKRATIWNPWVFFDGSLLAMGLDGAEWNVLIAAVAVLLGVSLLHRKGSVREKLDKQMFWFRYAVYLALLLATTVFGVYGPGFDGAQFLYMQF
ncbi:MAG: MBOAT family protein [Oscillospiraceae bacterium]|nr:MBOAT family protein [Oscillospiraceae bacterium]